MPATKKPAPKGPLKKAAKKAAAKKATAKAARRSPAKAAAAKKPAKKAPKKAAARSKAPTKPTKGTAKARRPARREVVARPREELTMVTELAATPAAVLEAWLDSAAHSAFTGADAQIDAVVGGSHSAWSGYIEGRILELGDDRVVMTWRTTEFAPDDPDSHLEVSVAQAPKGARVTLRHTNLPVGGAEKYGQGWRDHYFAPMSAYFRR